MLTATPSHPVRPHDLTGSGLVVVRNGARLSGCRADALLRVDPGEHRRRQQSGLQAIAGLNTLELCMEMPLGVQLGWNQLPPEMHEVIRRAPGGVFEISAGSVMRLACSVVTVDAVLLTGWAWTSLLQRVSGFGGVAQRVMVLSRVPRDLDERLWEAQVAGVGVWVARRGTLVEELAPEVFVPRLIKPARWRFQENAYAAWLKSTAELGQG